MYLSRSLVGILLLILYNCTIFAQDTRILTLEESIEIARQTNLSIQSTQEKVESAKAQERNASTNVPKCLTHQ